MKQGGSEKVRERIAAERRKSFDLALGSGSMEIRQMTAKERKSGIVIPQMKPKRGVRNDE